MSKKTRKTPRVRVYQQRHGEVLYGFLIACFLLIALAVVAYWPVFGNQFVNIDDDRYVTDNAMVLQGISPKNVLWSFRSLVASNWHPLTWISHMLDISLYGLNPAGHHATNLIFHIANTLLLFALLKFMTGARWRSAFVAALFAIHPVHVESVAWVAERKDVLSGFFWMLMLWAYVLYVRKPEAGRYVLVLITYAVGLLAKPMLVSLPLVLLLLDLWPLQRTCQGDSKESKTWKFLALEKIPLFVLSVASCVVTLYAQKHGGAVASLVRYPLYIRVENAVLSYCKYLLKALWPTNLAVFYPYDKHIPILHALGAVAILMAVTALSIRLYRHHRYVLIGWLWFLITLIPVIGLVQVGVQALADRYTYLPLTGIFIIIAWGVPDLAERIRSDRFRRLVHWRVLPIAALGIIGALTIGTRTQSAYWKDSLTLMRRTLSVTLDNAVAENNYAVALRDLGNAAQARHESVVAKYYFSLAERHFREVVRIDPEDVEGHFNLGVMFADRGETDEAISHFVAGLKNAPNDPKAHASMGTLLSRKGDVAGALSHFRKSLAILPNDAEARYNLAALLIKCGRSDEAVAELKKTVQIAPAHVAAYDNLGTIMFTEKRYPEAVRYFSEALRIKPDYLPARTNLAICYYYAGDYKAAWAQVKECQRLNGNLPQGLIQALSEKMPPPSQ
jgi:Flp pilus assembly protein TadD